MKIKIVRVTASINKGVPKSIGFGSASLELSEEIELDEDDQEHEKQIIAETYAKLDGYITKKVDAKIVELSKKMKEENSR